MAARMGSQAAPLEIGGRTSNRTPLACVSRGPAQREQGTVSRRTAEANDSLAQDGQPAVTWGRRVDLGEDQTRRSGRAGCCGEAGGFGGTLVPGIPVSW